MMSNGWPPATLLALILALNPNVARAASAAAAFQGSTAESPNGQAALRRAVAWCHGHATVDSAKDCALSRCRAKLSPLRAKGLQVADCAIETAINNGYCVEAGNRYASAARCHEATDHAINTSLAACDKAVANLKLWRSAKLPECALRAMWFDRSDAEPKRCARIRPNEFAKKWDSGTFSYASGRCVWVMNNPSALEEILRAKQTREQSQRSRTEGAAFGKGI